MKKAVLLAGVFLLAASLVFAAGPKTYQVTGPVLEVKDDVIVVEKGKEKWEIGRTKDTKVDGRPEGRLQGDDRVPDGSGLGGSEGRQGARSTRNK